MPNPTSNTREIMDFSGLALKVSEIQNLSGEVILDGETTRQTNVADLAVSTTPTTKFGALKMESVDIDVSGGESNQETSICVVPAGSTILGVATLITTQWNGFLEGYSVGVTGNDNKYLPNTGATTLGAAYSNHTSLGDETGWVQLGTSTEDIKVFWSNPSGSAGAIRATVIYYDPNEFSLGSNLTTMVSEIETTLNALIARLEAAGVLADA